MGFVVGLSLVLLGLPGVPGLIFLVDGEDLTLPRAVVILLGVPFYVPLVVGIRLTARAT